MGIKENLASLKQQDIYSLILFALFKMRKIPEYSTLSEMIYILDKNSMLKLCEYFGGQYIRFPTIDELESIIYALVLFQQVDIESKDYEETLENLRHKTTNIKQIKDDYRKLRTILYEYDFKPR